MNIAHYPASEQVIQREFSRGNFTMPTESSPALRFSSIRRKTGNRKNKKAIDVRIDLSFEQSRNSEPHTLNRLAKSLPDAGQVADKRHACLA